jgi:DNA-binding transcriptional regulator YhcF (GntR family)
LASVREMADNLGINMHTVRGAYLKLREQGIINMRLGRRATIAQPHQPVKNEESEAELQFRLEEWITDAILMGMTSDQIKQMVERHLNNMKDTN